MNEKIINIEIIKKIPFDGKEEDTLQNRLRKVSLRGFPEVKIYEDAKFNLCFLKPEDYICISTPQPRVYKPNLEYVIRLAELFKEKKINLFKLNDAYDYLAFYESGEPTLWTMLPPIVEKFYIPSKDGKLNYEPLIGEKLRERLKEKNLDINPELLNFKCVNDSETYNLINDGSHRIHCGLENGGINVLLISGMKPGFPYYAAPQPYSEVKLVEVRDDNAIETKIHVVQAPGHKDLYRLFPSGGIYSGDVRPDKRLKD